MEPLITLLQHHIDTTQWFFQVLFGIVAGCYVFTAGSFVYTWLVSQKVTEILTNHLKHITERLDKLETSPKEFKQ